MPKVLAVKKINVMSLTFWLRNNSELISTKIHLPRLNYSFYINYYYLSETFLAHNAN
jgi:hypothetical protein